MIYILLFMFVTITLPMSIALIFIHRENSRLHHLLTTNSKEYRAKLAAKLKEKPESLSEALDDSRVKATETNLFEV